MKAPDQTPNLLISLDFELRWGVHDTAGDQLDTYRANLEGVREVVPAMLRMFKARDVRATWACVGAMACENWEDYFRRAPAVPRYAEPDLVFDPRWADRDPDGQQHFAADLVTEVARTPGQEVGSHTFGHICLGEPGVMKRDVIADVEAAANVLEARTQTRPRSLVFPRNQVHFLDTLAQGGIRVVRDNAPGWWWRRSAGGQRSALLRSLRLWSTFRPHRVARGTREHVATLPASGFIRFQLPDPAFDASCTALANQARRLNDGELLHIWCHPHNLGDNPSVKLERLGRMIDRITEAAPAHAVWRTFGDFASA